MAILPGSLVAFQHKDTQVVAYVTALTPSQTAAYCVGGLVLLPPLHNPQIFKWVVPLQDLTELRPVPPCLKET